MYGTDLYRALTHIDPRIGLVVFSTVLAAVMLMHPVSTQQASHEMTVTINSSASMSVGVSVDTDRIDFGSLPDDALEATKEITVQNIEQYPATLHFHVDGNISEYVTLSQESVELPPGEQHTLDITLETSDSIAEGRYSGELTIYTRRPLYQLLLDRL